jgi:hypothetical protein
MPLRFARYSTVSMPQRRFALPDDDFFATREYPLESGRPIR